MITKASDKPEPTELEPIETDNPAEVIGPERVRLERDAFDRVVLTVDESRTFENVRAVRVFPISGKADYVSLLDETRKEVALMARPDKLDEESRRVLQEALSKMYYMPKIKQVFSITETMGVSLWSVMTDRGYANFEVIDREYIRKLPGERYIITDVDGNRFEIGCVPDLDARSQSLVYSET